MKQYSKRNAMTNGRMFDLFYFKIRITLLERWLENVLTKLNKKGICGNWFSLGNRQKKVVFLFVF